MFDLEVKRDWDKRVFNRINSEHYRYGNILRFPWAVPRQGVCRRCPRRAILVDLPLDPLELEASTVSYLGLSSHWSLRIFPPLRIVFVRYLHESFSFVPVSS